MISLMMLVFLALEVDALGKPVNFDPRVTRDYAQHALDIYRELGIDDETIAPALFAGKLAQVARCAKDLKHKMTSTRRRSYPGSPDVAATPAQVACTT